MSFELKRKAIRRSGRAVEILYLTNAALDQLGFVNAFSTRLGGVSPMPSGSLHLSLRHDDPRNVAENFGRFAEALGWDRAAVLTPRQTHSDIRVPVSIQVPSEIFSEVGPGDAVLAREGGALLGIKTADCLPVLIADPLTGARAAVHAGWRGTLARIAEKTVRDLIHGYRVNPARCVAVLGPHACGRCYEVGTEVVSQYESAFSNAREYFSPAPTPGKFYFDAALANRWQLERAGVLSDNIHIAPYCTMHHNDLFFSHSRESQRGGPVGRLLAVIGKKQVNLFDSSLGRRNSADLNSPSPSSESDGRGWGEGFTVEAHLRAGKE